MKLQGIHHVAYRCKDAKETVEWYGKYLDMGFILAIAEDRVPSTGEPDPYMHVFLDAGNGNVLAFFELPTKPEMDRDHNTPEWVQHLALKVDTIDSLMAAKGRLEDGGCNVLGPVDHTIFQSIYFNDPSGHRIELTKAVIRREGLEHLEGLRGPFHVACGPRTVPIHPGMFRSRSRNPVVSRR